MTDYRIKFKVDGREQYILADILFIAKTPAPASVDAGHYFQGRQGAMFWNRLSEYNILRVPYGDFADKHLPGNYFGITDTAKVPGDY